jgi:hypothetical protein
VFNGDEKPLNPTSAKTHAMGVAPIAAGAISVCVLLSA